jgi:hypothetical protein
MKMKINHETTRTTRTTRIKTKKKKNHTPRSGEKLDRENIGHRTPAKIEFAGKVKLPDARIACRDKYWWFDSP